MKSVGDRPIDFVGKMVNLYGAMYFKLIQDFDWNIIFTIKGSILHPGHWFAPVLEPLILYCDHFDYGSEYILKPHFVIHSLNLHMKSWDFYASRSLLGTMLVWKIFFEDSFVWQNNHQICIYCIDIPNSNIVTYTIQFKPIQNKIKYYILFF